MEAVRSILAAVVVAGVASACAGWSAPADGVAAAFEAAFEAAPPMVRDRPELPTCGSERVELQGGGTNLIGRQCLWDAYVGGRQAEFVSFITTLEGDPVTIVYRVLGADPVELFVDATQDRFGAGAWVHLQCPVLKRTDDGPLGFDLVAGEDAGRECVETILD